MSIRVVVIAGPVSAGVVGDEVSRRSVTMCRRPARVSTGRPQRAVVSRLTAEWLRSAALDRFGGGWL